MARITKERKKELDALCRRFRIELIELLHERQTGHPGGSLSVCEILTALYFEVGNVEDGADRDRILLSKGHAAPMLYIVLAELGRFPKEELRTLRMLDSRLQGHPCMLHTPGIEFTSGPLGMGLSVGIVMASGLRLDKSPATVFVVLGDGELNEGTVWEACMSAPKFAKDGLVAIVDRNHVQLDGSSEEIMPLGDLAGKFKAFGFDVFECDGHDIGALCEALGAAQAAKGKPAVVIAETVKGKGVSFMEGQSAWHGKTIDDEHFEIAMRELRGA
jgi:transketolase